MRQSLSSLLLAVVLAYTIRYFDFFGRATRREFIAVFLMQLVPAGIILLKPYLFGQSAFYMPIFIEHKWIMLAYLYMFIPSISVQVRRLHDINARGWWLILYLLPVLGFLVTLAALFIGPRDKSNRFGANPREEGNISIGSSYFWLCLFLWLVAVGCVALSIGHFVDPIAILAGIIFTILRMGPMA